jgi:DNA polymerase-3 subunit delta
MDYWELLREVEAGRVPAVVLLHGPEPFLLDDACSAITRRLFPEGSNAAFNRETFDGENATPEAIVRAALTFPFGAAARLIVVKAAQDLSSRGREALEAYLKNPSSSARLLLLATERLPASHWLLQALPASAVVEAPGMSDREMTRWLVARARVDGIEVTPEAAHLLVQWAGDDLAGLFGELQKAALAAGPANSRVGAGEVRAVVGEHRLRTVFDLTRAMERRETGQAIAVLEALLRAGEEPMKVLGMVAREVRSTWLAKEWLRQGKSAEEIARLLRRPRQSVEPFLARAEALSPPDLSRQLAACWEAERRMKSGGLPKPELTALLARLCGVR